MSGFQSVHFGAEGSLFSAEEVARLMEREFQRSMRYGYPLALLAIEVDRLESLHDLYGVESERRIVRAVVTLVRSATRPSDALGASRGQGLLVLLPHATREGAHTVARRLLAACRALEFRGDGRILRASLSIGLAAGGDAGGLAGLIERAQRALAGALVSGGDRVVEASDEPPAAHEAGVAENRPLPAGSARRAAAALPPLPAVRDLPGATLAEKVSALVRLAGGAADLEREVLAVLERTLGEARQPRATRAEILAEVRALEKKVAEQKRLLEASEEELARMLREKSVDPGIASLYHGVQGLDPLEHDYQRKRALLTVIYEANVELLKQLEKEARPGA